MDSENASKQTESETVYDSNLAHRIKETKKSNQGERRMEIVQGRDMKDFDTVKMPAVVEMNTYAGSAFAVNSQGEQIFINSRIMERMELEKGDQVTAYVLPNYEDKRDTIPWRAMRVDPAHGDIERILDSPDTKEFVASALNDFDKEIMRILWDKEYSGRLWTVKEISEVIDAEAVTTLDTASPFACHLSCMRLHERGFICRVDFSSDPKPTRSRILWTADIRDFED